MSWSSDNAIFNVNGEGLERLKKVLAVTFETFAGYRVHERFGLILYSYKCERATMFPVPITPSQAAEMAFKWLDTPEAKNIPCEGWDSNADHDGSNEKGWRVYTEDWGHADGDWNCVIVRPAYMWYGK